MAFRGVDIRTSGDRVLFRVSLKDSAGAKITTGTATLRVFELQSDGSLKSCDFNDNTFKTTALTTATVNMSHQTGNNSTYDTGIWTYSLTTVSGFTRGSIYLALVSHASASPAEQEREFQYGEGEGDFTVTSAGRVDVGNWLGSAPNALQSGRPDVYVGAASASVETEFANALLDDALSGHTTSGTAGAAINKLNTGVTLTGAEETAVANAVASRVYEGSLTLEQAIRLLLAAMTGKLSGAATTTVHIRDVADTKDRILATVDANGNRSTVTLDGA